MTETFSLILNAQNANNKIAGGSLTTYFQYYVNWDSVLPKKHQTFNVSFTLKSVNTATQITVNALVSINFGQANISDQNNSSSTYLGIAYPVPVQQSSTTWNYFYNSTLNDNPPVTISYPVNQIITVRFTNFDLTTALTMYNYVLQIQFTPVITTNSEQQTNNTL